MVVGNIVYQSDQYTGLIVSVDVVSDLTDGTGKDDTRDESLPTENIVSQLSIFFTRVHNLYDEGLELLRLTYKMEKNHYPATFTLLNKK